jgi:hypothetical protein
MILFFMLLQTLTRLDLGFCLMFLLLPYKHRPAHGAYSAAGHVDFTLLIHTPAFVLE